MSRVHQSADGKLRPCKAKTPEACRATGPGGEKARHFVDAEAGEATLAEEARAEYGTVPLAAIKSYDASARPTFSFTMDGITEYELDDEVFHTQEWIYEAEDLARDLEAARSWPEGTSESYGLDLAEKMTEQIKSELQGSTLEPPDIYRGVSLVSKSLDNGEEVFAVRVQTMVDDEEEPYDLNHYILIREETSGEMLNNPRGFINETQDLDGLHNADGYPLHSRIVGAMDWNGLNGKTSKGPSKSLPIEQRSKLIDPMSSDITKNLDKSPIYKKSAVVDMRIAKPGEKLSTVLKDGTVETT